MKNKFLFIFLGLLFFGFFILPGKVFAASRYWIANSAQDFNTADGCGNKTCWSTSSNGGGGASVPGASDLAIFDSKKKGDCNITATTTIGAVTISSGYTGTITQNDNVVLTISGAFLQADGTFTSGASTTTSVDSYTQTGGIFNAPTNFYVTGYYKDVWVHSAGTFNHNNGTVYFQDSSSQTGWQNISIVNASTSNTETFYNLIINFGNSQSTLQERDAVAQTSIVLNNLTVTKGILANRAYMTYDVRGNVLIDTTGYIYNPAALKFSGGNTQTFEHKNYASDYIKAPIIIAKTAGTTLRLLSSVTFDAPVPTATFTSGILDLNGNTFGATRGPNISIGGTFVIAGAGTFNIGTYTQSSLANISITGTSTFNVTSQLYINGGSFDGGSATISAESFKISSGTFTAPANFYLTGKQLTIWDHTGGTFNHNNGTIYLTAGCGGTSNQTFNVSSGTEIMNNLVINFCESSSYFYITANQTLKLVGNLTSTKGFIGGGSGSKLELQGNVSIGSSGSFGNPASTVFSGSNDQTYSNISSSPQLGGTISIDKTSGTLRLLSNMVTQGGVTITLTQGRFDTSSYIVSGGGAFVVASSSSATLAIGSADGIVSSGSYGSVQSSTRTFNTGANYEYNSSSSQVTGNGLPASVNNFIHSGSGALTMTANLTVNGNWTNSAGTIVPNSKTVTFGGCNQTVSGSATFYNFTKSVSSGNCTLTFTHGSTQTISSGGTLTLNGNSTYKLTIASDSSADTYLTVNGNFIVDKVDVSYNNASGGKTIVASNSTDSGNNTNWAFVSDGESPNEVWDNFFKGVWHLPNGSTLSAYDSTVNANHATSTASTATTGQVDGAGEATSGKISLTQNSSLKPASAFTISAWAKRTGSLSTSKIAYQSPQTAGNVGGFNIVGQANNSMSVRVDTSGSGSWTTAGASTVLTSGQWYYLTGKWDGSKLQFYVNNTKDNSDAGCNAMSYGSTGSNSAIGIFPGALDEVRVSSIRRSDDWTKFEYCNMVSSVSGTCAGNNEYTLGSQEGGLPSQSQVIQGSE